MYGADVLSAVLASGRDLSATPSMATGEAECMAGVAIAATALPCAWGIVAASAAVTGTEATGLSPLTVEASTFVCAPDIPFWAAEISAGLVSACSLCTGPAAGTATAAGEGVPTKMPDWPTSLGVSDAPVGITEGTADAAAGITEGAIDDAMGTEGDKDDVVGTEGGAINAVAGITEGAADDAVGTEGGAADAVAGITEGAANDAAGTEGGAVDAVAAGITEGAADDAVGTEGGAVDAVAGITEGAANDAAGTEGGAVDAVAAGITEGATDDAVSTEGGAVDAVAGITEGATAGVVTAMMGGGGTEPCLLADPAACLSSALWSRITCIMRLKGVPNVCCFDALQPKGPEGRGRGGGGAL